MNKYTLHIAGGALLATTALASGTLSAATIKAEPYTGGTTTFGAGLLLSANAVSAINLASQALTATASGTTIGPYNFLVDSTANLTGGATVSLTVTGADFLQTAVPSFSIAQQETGGSLTQLTTAGANVIMFPDRIYISGMTATTWSVMQVCGASFRNAQSLATAGNSIALAGSITNSAATVTLETITSANVVTSRSAVTVQVAAGSGITISNTTSTQFTGVIQTGVTSGSTSAVLSSVTFTEIGNTVSANLTTSQSVATLLSNYEVRLTHAILSDAAVTQAQLASAAGNIVRTPAQFVSGAVTFGTGPAADAAATRALTVQFNGTTPILAAAAGTTAVTPTGTAASATAITAVTGSATALNRGGLNTTLNFVQPSVNNFASFIRVTNTGATAGSVTMSIRNAATGVVLGVYTSLPVAGGGTIQVSTSTIETGAVPAITPVAGTPYDVNITGPITGFAQHIGFNAANGALSDLSAFRNGGAANP